MRFLIGLCWLGLIWAGSATMAAAQVTDATEKEIEKYRAMISDYRKNIRIFSIDDIQICSNDSIVLNMLLNPSHSSIGSMDN